MFDHILTSWNRACAQVAAQPGVSDHLPVVLTIGQAAAMTAEPVTAPGT